MKNLSKQILILILLLASQFFSAFGQNNIIVFNKPVNLSAPLTTNEFATGYPLSIGASHVRNCEARMPGAADINEIFNAVSNTINEQDLPLGIPVMGAFFTTQFNNDTLNIKLDQTHGFCFAFHKDYKLTLYYFERNTNGKFDPVPNLTTRINTISEDLFLSLHYSRFAPGSYPDKSTIFSFICDTLGKVDYADSSDVTIALSKDYKRVTGLFPIGMADSLILLSCDQPNGGSSKCHGPCTETTPNTHCVAITDMSGTTNRCVLGHDRCAAGAIERRSNQEHLNLGVPIKYKRMRDFRDKFMINYCEGRKYIGFYYTFSKYAKMSISMLWKYASVLPDLYSAMENLTDESSDKIIFTPSLREKVLEILNDHKDVGDSYFQSILIEVEKDLEKFTGLKRSEVIAMLSPYGNCNGQRQALTEQSGVDTYFVTVYDNPGRDEIVVNYSVSGSRIKFDLFNTTASLVSSINDALPQQKLSISTSHLDPGIYIYRITSDSGYEKIGKVVVVK